MMLNTTVEVVLGAVFTLLIFSYLLGENPLYRLALHIFVGATVGYAVGVTVHTVFLGLVWPRLTQGGAAEAVYVLIPVLLGILWLTKGLPRVAQVGNIAVAFLLGVGAAVAVGGALLGTIVPQVGATGVSLNPLTRDWTAVLNGLFVVIGTVGALLAFTFTVRRQEGLGGLWARLVRIGGWVGRVFLVVTFGVAFAGAMTSGLSLFVDRMRVLVDAFFQLFFGTAGG